MKRFMLSVLAALICLCPRAETVAAEETAPKGLPTAKVQLNGHEFTLPEGFAIELIAGPSVVERPIVADFDDEGRLYVADSSGTNDKVDKQLAERPHRILRLEDTDADGQFDKSIVFADKMMFPEGTMWFDGSLYVAAPPSIWKLTDTSGDGVADQRSEWFQGKTLGNCANDLHGPYRGPDGWIYWAKGAFAKQTYERPGKPPLVTRASHLFRCRPDGSGIEAVMTGGMDNPVDIVFTPGGERIFTTTFLQNPGGGRRDGLLHAVYGGVYGKVHEVIEDHPRTAPDVLPVLTHLGPAAPCGLTRYESNALGTGYENNVFAALFNLQKITRHVLEGDGATFKTLDTDFLVSTNKDFHPTDVLEDADGSLIVVDTGGWYKLCCPTSQLVKPDVLGAIYRVRRKDAPRLEDPRGQKLDWAKVSAAELAGRLHDPRPAVRDRAIHTLAKHGPAALPALTEALRAGKSNARRSAVWTATRIDTAEARTAIRSALADADETVRQAALHSVALRRDAQSLPQLVRLLDDGAPQNKRAAAEAIGRIGDPSAIPALLRALEKPADRMLEHSLTFALIEIANPKRTALGLESAHVLSRRAALIALDQMPNGGLNPETVARNLTSNEGLIKEAAAWIVSRHPEWGGSLAGFLRERLSAENLSPVERTELEQQLARFAKASAIQELLADRLGAATGSQLERRSVLRAMAQSGLKEVPGPWIAGLSLAVAGQDGEMIAQAVSTARALRVPKERAGELPASLMRVASQAATPVNVRLDALAAITGGLPVVTPELFAFLRGQLSPDQAVSARSAAVDVLSTAKLTPEQLAALTDSLRTAGPLELDRLLTSFGQSTDEQVGLQVVAALKQSAALTTLRVETLKPRLAKFGPRVQSQAEDLYRTLTVNAAQQTARLEELLPTLTGGDIRAGQAVFNSTKAACAACHAIGYLGGNAGPDLTRIGQIRTERDLLEAIVFPSASFVRSFEPVAISTTDGKVYNGLIRKDSSDEIILATGPNQQVRIAREDIDEIHPSTLSIMPAGLDRQLSAKELADLLAFLRACK